MWQEIVDSDVTFGMTDGGGISKLRTRVPLGAGARGQ